MGPHKKNKTSWVVGLYYDEEMICGACPIRFSFSSLTDGDKLFNRLNVVGWKSCFCASAVALCGALCEHANSTQKDRRPAIT